MRPLPRGYDPTRYPGPAILYCNVHWCGHCKATRPTMEKVSQALGSVIPVFDVDGDAFPDFMKRWNVQGYPTILLASGGTLVEFSGDRTFDAITSFACGNTNLCARL